MIFAGASALLHIAWFLLMRGPVEAPSASRSQSIELQIVSPPEPEPLAAIEPPPPQQPPQPLAARPDLAPERRRERTPRPAEAPATRQAEATPPAPVAEASRAEPEAPAAPPPAAPRAIDLSPRRAASTMIDQVELARVCSPNSGAASAPACDPPDRTGTAERQLNESLRTAANAPAYRAQREPPRLQREADGAYRYDGHVFTARIRPDGLVDFIEDPDAQVTGLSSVMPGVAGRFDLTDAIEHGVMGKERYSAEKRWFLDQTAALRERLTEAARAEEAVRARRALALALERIVAARELSPAQKRARVLELWSDCGDDADSRAARRTVEEFVRAHMPLGSALGFSVEELGDFNRGRRGMAAFDPYRES